MVRKNLAEVSQKQLENNSKLNKQYRFIAMLFTIRYFLICCQLSYFIYLKLLLNYKQNTRISDNDKLIFAL